MAIVALPAWSLRRLRRALRDQSDQLARSGEGLAEALARRTSDLASLQRDHMSDLREAVSRQLEQVQRGVGEIQGLAAGLSDLQRTLGNVKRRGTWGEAQLEQLLGDLLAPSQYDIQVPTRPGSAERVDAALRLARADGTTFLLPIDAKLPQEDYARLLDAREHQDGPSEARALRKLAARVRAEAQQISRKYIDPPHTTDFAILFVPTESLYAELLRVPDLLGQLHRDSSVTLAGPANLAALLSSIRLGLRALALHARAGEIWQQLGTLRLDLERLTTQLERARKHVEAAARSLEQAGVHAGGLARGLETTEALQPEAPESCALVASPLQREAPLTD